MTLQTSRLMIKELSEEDLESIHQLHSLPEVDEYNTLGIPVNIEVTASLLQEWISQQAIFPRCSYVFRIELTESGDFIGLIALNLGKPNFKLAEIWYKTDPRFWKKGYTTEAVNALLEFSFSTLKLHRVEAGCAVENKASIKILEKVGMTREGSKRKILPIRGEWVDNYFYAILDTDFKKIMERTKVL
jgi:RimJ/RimL family protein N-acetyltransferase